MAKVLFVGRWFPPRVGGIEISLYEFYRRLPAGWVDLVLPDEPGAAAFDAGQTLPILRVGLPAGVSSDQKRALGPLLTVALRRLWRGGYSQVHCGHLLTGVVGLLARRLWGLPYVVFAYGAELTGGGLGPLKALVLRQATAVVVNSQDTKAVVVGLGVPPGRAVVIHPGVDLDRYRPDLDGGSIRRRLGLGDRPLLLTVGRLDRSSQYKGHDTVIRALPAIRQHTPDVAYVIAGAGNDGPRLAQLARETGVSDAVRFVGYVPDAELPLYFAACDLFIMPNRRERSGSGQATEGFGMVFIEAAACAKPVIGGNVGGTTDAIVADRTGLLLDQPDAAHTAAAVTALLGDPARARLLGVQGYRRAVAHFTWDAGAQKLERVIRVIQQRQERSR